MGLFRVLPDFGMAYASTLEISRDRERARALTGGLLGLQLWLSLATVLLCLAIGRALYDGVILFAVAWLSADLVLKGVKTTLRWMLKGLERFGVEAVSLLVERAATLGFGLASLLLGYGVHGFVIAFALVRAVDVAGLALFVDRRVFPLRPRVDTRLWGEMFRKGLPFAYAGLVITLVFQVDALLLERLRGALEVGYYRAPTLVLEGLTLVPRIFGYALIPTMAATFATSPATVTSLYRRGCKYLLLVGLPVAIFGALASDRFIPMLFGDGFLPSVPLARILLPAAVFMFLSNFAETALACVSRWRTIVIASTLALAVNVVLNLIFIPSHGALGSAWATLATEAFYFLMTTGAMAFQAGHRIGWATLSVKPLAVAAVFGAVLVAAAPLGLVGGSVAASLAFVAATLGLRVFDTAEWDALRAVLGRARPAV